LLLPTGLSRLTHLLDKIKDEHISSEDNHKIMYSDTRTIYPEINKIVLVWSYNTENKRIENKFEQKFIYTTILPDNTFITIVGNELPKNNQDVMNRLLITIIKTIVSRSFVLTKSNLQFVYDDFKIGRASCRERVLSCV
jgi:hypothetical protein